MHFVIRFRKWEDYVRGLDIAASIGTVVCKPGMRIVVTPTQKASIERAGIEYE